MSAKVIPPVFGHLPSQLRNGGSVLYAASTQAPQSTPAYQTVKHSHIGANGSDGQLIFPLQTKPPKICGSHGTSPYVWTEVNKNNRNRDLTNKDLPLIEKMKSIFLAFCRLRIRTCTPLFESPIVAGRAVRMNILSLFLPSALHSG
jgi:hypothetical protein